MNEEDSGKSPGELDRRAFLEQALAMLRKESGSHFDPNVVMAFVAAQERIIAARDRVNRGETPSLDDIWRMI